ncbi:alpha/beta fold hydrolase [Bacillus taeanensis]|uniref:Alpha/beta hydrolase n=1 Tax=Bacillus taeanensis TaxID=273032 RepID=A0A366XT64_9BACI|nr:alpha/beta hydrolase [Bacillus taeanensis]RBW68345.1 alpha/beta hydrolase [Bacillus taeanensis]
MRDLKIKANGLDFHVVDYGGTGRTILCVHGLTANCRYWDAFAERMKSSYHVLAVDLRGRGDSAKPPSGYNIPQHAADLNALLDSLQIDQTIYAGHSLGAMIGTYFAAHYQERLSHLILVDGGGDVDEKVIEMVRPAVNRLGELFSDFDRYLNEMKKNPLFHDWNSYMEQYFYADVHHFEDGSVSSKVKKEAVREEVEGLRHINLNALHSKIEVPTLVLIASDCFMDGKTFLITEEKGKELEALMPNSRFVEMEGANHYTIILTKYDQLVLETKKFLAGAGVRVNE